LVEGRWGPELEQKIAKVAKGGRKLLEKRLTAEWDGRNRGEFLTTDGHGWTQILRAEKAEKAF
jgi:hypothetical protein